MRLLCILSRRLEFFSNYFPECFLQSFIVCLKVYPQGIINQGLVISAAGFMHDAFKMLNDIRIQTNRDSYFFGIGFYNRTSLTFTELFTHDSNLENKPWFPSYLLCGQK